MSNTRFKVLLAMSGLLAISVILSGCGRGTIAKIDGRRITKDEYYTRLEHLSYRDPQSGQPMEAGQWVLSRLIDEELIQRLAETEKVPPTEEQVNERIAEAKKTPNFATQLKQMGYTPEQFKQMVKVEQALFNLQTKGVTITDKEVKDYYSNNISKQFTQPESLEMAGIFTKSKADTDKAIKMLQSNMEFGTVAKLVSVERNSAENLGNLPRMVVRGDKNIPPAVQDILFNTPEGKYTKPIPDGTGGYGIFKINRHKKATVVKFPTIQYALRQQLMIAKGVEKHINVQADLEKFKQKANIQVEIERYKASFAPPKPAKPAK